MHRTKLALLALTICLAISLFDGVDAISKSKRKALARAKAAAKGAQPPAKGAQPPATGSSTATKTAPIHTGKKTLPDEWKEISELLVDEVMHGKDHMVHVKFNGFRGKLLDHLKHPDIKPKHKIAAPHEIKEAQLKAIYAPLEVAIVTHTLAKMEKKKLMEKIVQFMHAKTYYNSKGEKEPAHRVEKLEQDPINIIGQMIRAEAIEMMKKNGYYEHSDPKSRTQLKKVYPVMTKAMKIKEIAEKITHLVKEYNENHHGKNTEDKKKNDGTVKPHNHGEGIDAANHQDKKKTGLTVEIPKLKKSHSGNSLSGSPLPSASRSSGGVGGGHGPPSPSGHHSQTLGNVLSTNHKDGSPHSPRPDHHHPQTLHDTPTNITPTDPEVSQQRDEEESSLQERGELLGNGSYGNGNDDGADANVSNAGLGKSEGIDSEPFAQTSGTSSFDERNDFGQSEGEKQLGDDEVTKQDDTEFGDPPTDVSRKEYPGSASEAFDNTNANDQEDTEDSLVKRDESPIGAGTGTGGVEDEEDPSGAVIRNKEGDMNEDKVDPSVVEADPVMEGNIEGGLASSTGDGDGKIESKFPEEEDDKENVSNKGTKKAGAETDNALE